MKTIRPSVPAIALLAALSLSGCGPYNRLVELQEGADAAWSQVENVYQRRADLIPNLVATVKGAADFEQGTLTAVVEARAKVGQVQIQGVPDAQQLAQFQQAQDGLTSALSRLLVVVEQYPELKATQAFRDLQAQLEGAENRISIERHRFNEAVQAYNTYRRQVPGSFYAGAFGFGEKPYFQSAPGAAEVPTVQF
jgi:LemA protein